MKSVLLILSMLLTNNLMAGVLKVVTPEWEGYTSKSGKGYYMELLRTVYGENNVAFAIVPYARALKMVKNGEADIALGVYQGDIPDKYLGSYVVEQDFVDALVTDKLAKSWKGESSLEGKRVLAMISYAFDGHTEVSMDYSEKSTLIGMVKMLSVGRADVILDYYADLETILAKLEMDKGGYTIIRSVLSSQVYFAFSDTATGNTAKTDFDKSFEKLFEEGKIKPLMEKDIGHSNGLPTTLKTWKK